MVTAKLDTREFDTTLRRYSEVTLKSIPTILNTKAWRIATAAMRNTPKADRAEIERDLGKVMLGKRIKGGRGKREFSLKLQSADAYHAPLAALLVNKGRHPGLFGTAMQEAIRTFIGKRNSSIAFLKSGWIPAIRALWPLAEKKDFSTLRVAKTRRDWGSVKTAKPGWNSEVIIENFANSPKDKKGALQIYGFPALQKAFNDEAISMKKYIERKLAENARKVGAVGGAIRKPSGL